MKKYNRNITAVTKHPGFTGFYVGHFDLIIYSYMQNHRYACKILFRKDVEDQFGNGKSNVFLSYDLLHVQIFNIKYK